MPGCGGGLHGVRKSNGAGPCRAESEGVNVRRSRIRGGDAFLFRVSVKEKGQEVATV